MEKYDIIIIGAGIYGLYASLNENFSQKRILILEKEEDMLTRASYINQARVHNGYHYPRSISTAKTSAKYFDKFYEEYKFAINKEFKSIYAISKDNSYISKEEFETFCKSIHIPYQQIDASHYFKDGLISGAYETKEYVYDINLIRMHYKEKISKKHNIEISYHNYIKEVELKNSEYILLLNDGNMVKTNCIINTSYASVNQINELFNLPTYDIKYELCEVEIGEANQNLKDVGITIMDGPFFSVMPFGKTGFHSLTSVNHTPHDTCYETLPNFDCQKKSKYCSKFQLDNCNHCKYKPKTKVKDMLSLYKQYLKEEYKFSYKKSLFTIKPILLSSEQDDSRPTIITKHRDNPTFISCFSGKFNTIYLLDEFIDLYLGETKKLIGGYRNESNNRLGKFKQIK